MWWRAKRFEVDLKSEMPLMVIKGDEDLFEFRLDLFPQMYDDIVEFARDLLSAAIYIYDEEREKDENYNRVCTAKKILDVVVKKREEEMRKQWDEIMGKRGD